MSIQKHFEGYIVCHGEEHMAGSIMIAWVAAWLVLLHLCLESKEWQKWDWTVKPQTLPVISFLQGEFTLLKVQQHYQTALSASWWPKCSNVCDIHIQTMAEAERFGVSLGYVLRSAQKQTHRVEENKGLLCFIIILTKYFGDAKDFV